MPSKTVLITGCSAGGIGHTLAMEFQRRGLTVFATARSTSKMSGLEKLPNTTLLSLDVTSPTSIAEAVERIKAQTGGKLDYLVNNSGRNIMIPALDADIDDAKEMFDVNFWGILRMVQGFAPLLIEAKGTIVNIGSIVAYLHKPFTSKLEFPERSVARALSLADRLRAGLYNASKAAVHQFDETLRLEMAPLGVKVVTVVTGSIETNIITNCPEPHLPPTSRYLAAKGALDKQYENKLDFKQATPDAFAKQVVGDVLGGAVGKVFRGPYAGTVRWASHIMPMWMQDRILLDGSDLDKVGKTAS
ncbi:oxidoreductase [Exophiala viscosa]|uniref:Oxidoreductase n=1 Tax=Exophiala viscosa TaxID=2486360 RepID=A0AAN6DPW4_9EURO|nr:oxidoreductase [Exophiala viscosa]